jgi:hypothetical protein
MEEVIFGNQKAMCSHHHDDREPQAYLPSGFMVPECHESIAMSGGLLVYPHAEHARETRTGVLA